MNYMWFTGVNCFKLAVEKDHDSIFTTICMKPCKLYGMNFESLTTFTSLYVYSHYAVLVCLQIQLALM